MPSNISNVSSDLIFKYGTNLEEAANALRNFVKQNSSTAKEVTQIWQNYTAGMLRIEKGLSNGIEILSEQRIAFQSKLEGELLALKEKVAAQVAAIQGKLSAQVKAFNEGSWAIEEKLAAESIALKEKVAAKILVIEERLASRLNKLQGEITAVQESNLAKRIAENDDWMAQQKKTQTIVANLVASESAKGLKKDDEMFDAKRKGDIADYKNRVQIWDNARIAKEKLNAQILTAEEKLTSRMVTLQSKIQSSTESANAATGRYAITMESLVRYTQHWMIRMGMFYAAFKIVELLNDATFGFITYTRELQKSAEVTRMTTQEFQKLEYAGKMNLISSEKLTRYLDAQSKAIIELKDKTGDAHKAFRILGITYDQLKGKSPYEQLLLIADGFKNVKNEEDLNTAATIIYQRQGREMIAMFKDGSDGIKAYGKQLQDLGVILSDDFVEQSMEAAKGIEKLKAAFELVKIWIGVHFVPWLNTLFDGIFSTLTKIREETAMASKETLKQIGNDILQATKQFTAFDFSGGVINFSKGSKGKVPTPESENFLAYMDALIKSYKELDFAKKQSDRMSKEDLATLDSLQMRLHLQNQAYLSLRDLKINEGDVTKKGIKLTEGLGDATDKLTGSYENLAAQVDKLYWDIELYQINQMIEGYDRYVKKLDLVTAGMKAYNEEKWKYAGQEQWTPEGQARKMNAGIFITPELPAPENIQSGYISNWQKTVSQMKSIWSVGTEEMTKTGNVFFDLMLSVAKDLASAFANFATGMRQDLSDAFYRMMKDGESFSVSFSKMWEDTKDRIKRAIADMASSLIMNLTGLGALEKLNQFKEGGFVSEGPGSLPFIPSAAQGMITPSNVPESGMLVRTHKNELIAPLGYIGELIGLLAQRVFESRSMPASSGVGGGGWTVNIIVNANKDFNSESFWDGLCRNKIRPALARANYGR